MAYEQRQRSEKEEKKTYRCSVCDRSYASRASVKRHEQDVHCSKYCCDKCSFRTAHRKDLERHYAQHASSLAPIRVHTKTPVTAPIKVSKAPSTQSRSRSRSRSPVARRRSPPHHRPPFRSVTPPLRHSPPFRSVTPPLRHSSPSRSVTPVMDEAEAADVELGSDCNLLALTCGRRRWEAARSPVPPVTRSPRRSDAEVQVRPADIDGTVIRNRLDQLRAESTSVTDSIDHTTRRVLRPGRTWTRRLERYVTAAGEWLEVQTDTVSEN